MKEQNNLNLIKNELIDAIDVLILKKDKMRAATFIHLISRLQLNEKQKAKIEYRKKVLFYMFGILYDDYFDIDKKEIKTICEFFLAENESAETIKAETGLTQDEFQTTSISAGMVFNLIEVGMSGYARDFIFKIVGQAESSGSYLFILHTLKSQDFCKDYKRMLFGGAGLLLSLEDSDCVTQNGLSISFTKKSRI